MSKAANGQCSDAPQLVVAHAQASAKYNTVLRVAATTASAGNWDEQMSGYSTYRFLALGLNANTMYSVRAGLGPGHMTALRHGLSFWAAYALACVWLVPCFFLHRWLTQLLG